MSCVHYNKSVGNLLEICWKFVVKKGREIENMDEFKESRCVLAASATVLAIVLSRRQRRRNNKAKRLWTRPWIQMRQQHGAYHCLLKELRMSDNPFYRNFLRMDEGAFEELSHAICFFLGPKPFLIHLKGGRHFVHLGLVTWFPVDHMISQMLWECWKTGFPLYTRSNIFTTSPKTYNK